MMRDYLLMDPTGTGFARVMIPGDDGPTLPPQALTVIAYSNLGTDAIMDEAGEIVTSGEPPKAAPGSWIIWAGDVPVELDGLVQSDGDRNVGLPLPVGIVGLSTVWAGMTIVQATA